MKTQKCSSSKTKYLTLRKQIKTSLPLLKLYNISIGLQLVKAKQRKLLQSHLEIDGDARNFLNIQNPKLRLKIYLSKAQQGVENRRQLEDQPSQLTRHFQEWRLLSIPKQDTLEKTQARLSKICTLMKLNLAKIGVNNYKRKFDNYNKNVSQRTWDQVYLQILDSMLGPNWTDQSVKVKKLEDLRKGHYNDQVITLLQTGFKPELEIEGPYPPQRPITRSVKQIANILYSIYSDKIKANTPVIDVQKQALKYVEQEGIVFIDEIDKLASSQGPSMTRGVSTQGVQRDLLPLIEGTVINTKMGDIKTDHILFIASGSFSMSKVQDLIPQLLGRLPIRVQLSPVSLEELQRILRQPQFNLLMQQSNLLEMENINLRFQDQAIKEMARFAYQLNLNTENIGARRLQAIVEKVIQDVSFDAPKYAGTQFTVNKQYVQKKLKPMYSKTQLSKFLI